MASSPIGWASQGVSWVLVVLTTGGVAAVLALFALGCSAAYTGEFGQTDLFGTLMTLVTAAGYALIGALIVRSRPGNRIGWLSLLIGFTFMVFNVSGVVASCSLGGILSLPGTAVAAWLAYVVPLISLVLLFILLPFLFPDGRFLTPRWRRLAAVLLLADGLLILLIAFRDGLLDHNGVDSFYDVQNPFGLAIIPAELGPLLARSETVLVVITAMLAIGSLVLRWRRSAGETRQQMKWFAFFLATAVTLQLAIELYGDIVDPAVFGTWYYSAIVSAVFIGFPVVIGIAVLRYRLYDIDIIIRRTLVYGLLTAVLVAIYFGVVLLAQSAFVAITGQESPIAIVISTLVIAALFNPLRQRLQAFIDRRFYRSQYDAAQTLETFAETARDEVDLEQLSSVLLRSVNETMQPETAGLWLKSGEEV